MNNMKYLTGLEKKGNGKLRALERTAGFLFTLILALLTVGCLVDNDDYNQTSREIEEYQVKLQNMRLANDQLNREIIAVYDECEALNSQLAVLAALNIHDKYTDGLKRVEAPAVTPPPRVRETPRATTPPRTSRPTVNTDTSAPRREASGQRGSSGQGSGGSSASPSPPPSPSRTDGAIDWGF